MTNFPYLGDDERIRRALGNNVPDVPLPPMPVPGMAFPEPNYVPGQNSASLQQLNQQAVQNPGGLAAPQNGMQASMQAGVQGNVPATSAALSPENQQYQMRVLSILQKIASLEMAGVCIYALFAQTLNGKVFPAIAEKFAESRDESITHYNMVIDWILYYQGRQYVTATPAPDEMQTLQIGDEDTGIEIALAKAIDHESRAEECYVELYSATQGQADIPLNNWAQDMATNERMDLIEFMKLTGEI